MTAESRAFSIEARSVLRWTTVSSNVLACRLGACRPAVSPVAHHEPRDQRQDNQDDGNIERAKGLADLTGVPGRTRPGQRQRPGERPEESVDDKFDEVPAGHTRRKRYEGADHGHQSGEEGGCLSVLL